MADNPMTPTDASRIQSHADRTGTNQGFKGRAQSSAAKNSGGGGKGGGHGSHGSHGGGHGGHGGGSKGK